MAEMTGRRGRIVRVKEGGRPRYQARESDSNSVDSLNIQEVCHRLNRLTYVYTRCHPIHTIHNCHYLITFVPLNSITTRTTEQDDCNDPKMEIGWQRA